MLGSLLGRSARGGSPTRPPVALGVERLELREVPAVTATLDGGVLNIIGDSARDNVRVSFDELTNQLVVQSFLVEVWRFDSAAVSSILLSGGDGAKNVLTIDPDVLQPATILGGDGADILRGGGGPTTLLGAGNVDKLVAGPGATTLDGDGGLNRLLDVKLIDVVIPNPGDHVAPALPVIITPNRPPLVLEQSEVQTLLQRASAATPSNDGIIAIVDRGGRLLGVFVESGVSPNILNNPQLLGFAIDGAIAKARTGAFFGNNEAPLTSRTIQNLSETTMTQREIQSFPFINDPNSTLRGPGFVAPQGLKSHFPAGIPYTPQVDLFAIEHTNRDSIISPGLNRVREAVLQGDTVVPGGDDIQLAGRFNIPDANYRPDIVADGLQLSAPEAYGFLTGTDPTAQSRGIATLPGGIPIYKREAPGLAGEVVGGIGVFYPGQTGWATEENSALSNDFNPALPDRSFEAEFVAFAAVGGIFPDPPRSNFNNPLLRITAALGGVEALPNIGITLLGTGRIDLVGLTLDVFGPNGNDGPNAVLAFAAANPGGSVDGDFLPVNIAGDLFQTGKPVPDGWIVPPRDGVGITAAEVNKIISDGIAQASMTRAAIRLPFNRTTRMVLAVSDLDGNIVGLFRMPDSTIFSIDVAVAKSRNVNYYANPAKLQPADQLPGIEPGTALTNRSFRYLSLPFFPEGIDGTQPGGPFSILNDGGVNFSNGLNQGPPLPAGAYQSVKGFDAFFPQSNFHDVTNIANQNGIVFFPGSAPLYRNRQVLIGGFGVSGDGVDQDDVVTFAGAIGFEAPPGKRIDEVFFRGVRVPYQKFNRNPEGGVVT